VSSNRLRGSPGTISAPTYLNLDQSDNISRRGPGRFSNSSGVFLIHILYVSPVPLA
jgi:hypothetical protein